VLEWNTLLSHFMVVLCAILSVKPLRETYKIQPQCMNSSCLNNIKTSQQVVNLLLVLCPLASQQEHRSGKAAMSSMQLSVK